MLRNFKIDFNEMNSEKKNDIESFRACSHCENDSTIV